MTFPWNISQDWYKDSNQSCVYWPIIGSYKNCQIINFIDIIKQHESTNTDTNFYIKQNSIRKIVLDSGKYISDNDYEEISTIDKNAENWYSVVKGKSDSYNLEYYHKIGIDFIKYGDLVCDAVYFNPFANSKQLYRPYGEKMREKNCQVE